jgi:hypothetical protein
MDVVVKHLSHGNEVLATAIANAINRGVEYDIPAFKEHDKMGRLWLVAGGPKSQTYWTEERIIKKAIIGDHNPQCQPKNLCDDCIDAIVDASDKPNKVELMKQIMDAAKERAEASV